MHSVASNWGMVRTALGLRKKKQGQFASYRPPELWQVAKDQRLLQRMLSHYRLKSVSNVLSPSETMPGANYMWVGQAAVESIIAAVAASKLTKITRVLDMPCGHGRVLRHLRVLLPTATIDACDLDAEGVRFCADTFGAIPIYSNEDLTSVRFEGPYDLIWIGSLFTHTSYEITKKWLTFLSTLLSDTGIIVATFHGRWTVRMQPKSPIIDDAKWSIMFADYTDKGYGYHDYDRQEKHSFIEGSYGISVSKAPAIIALAQNIPGTRLFMYQERGWGENHDVIAFGKPDWDTAEW